MLRTLGSLLLASVLTACGSEAPADEPATASRVNCEVAFQQIDEDARSMPRLEANVRALDSTIEQCPTVEDWIEVATEELPDVDLSDAEAFLAARCEETQLAETVLCEEI